MLVYLVFLIRNTEAMSVHHPMCRISVHRHTTCVSAPDCSSEIFLPQRQTQNRNIIIPILQHHQTNYEKYQFTSYGMQISMSNRATKCYKF